MHVFDLIVEIKQTLEKMIFSNSLVTMIEYIGCSKSYFTIWKFFTGTDTRVHILRAQ